MAKLGQTYVANELPESSFDPIPAGTYQVKIADCELKDTKDGTGKYLNLRYDVLGPAHIGRVVFGMINIRNKSQKAEEIGLAELGKLLRAIGLPKVEDTDELLGHDLTIRVKIEEATDEFPAKNVVTSFEAIGDTPAPKTTTTKAASAPPWAK